MKGQCIYFLRLEEWLVGDIPFYLKFWAKLTHHTFQNADFRSIFTRSPSTATTSEKSSVITNGKSTTTGFPLCIHYYYDANRAQKCKLTVFHIKVDFFRRKSATKFLCVKTVSGKVVRHSLAYLIVNKWLVGNIPFYLKFCTKLTHPLEKR